ncbi:MAG TPA: DUF4214 domain-containing protein [Gemmataceae bacterium]|jgi:autotransporter-associated beta strand protein|nr:DUF4214 domain-containing protein [Gemmataceae bacterium]
MRNSQRSHSNNRPSNHKRSRCRPFLEQLEDRRLFATNITQYHVDYQSTGANLTETQLTSSNVNAADFGQLYNTHVDGQVYAQPLVLTNVTIVAGPNTRGTPGTYNAVVFVATQHDSLYAINAAKGAILWQRTFLDTTNANDYLPGATSVTTIPNGDTDTDDISPEIGITSTPVIDASNNILYVLPNTKEMVGGNAYYVQRLHAINIDNGTDATATFVIGTTTGSNENTNTTPIEVNGTGDGNVNDVVQFNALRENNRPALSLVNGEVYAEWASHGDNGPYHGWIVAWNVTNLSTHGIALSGVLCMDPNGGEGGIWGGGGGLTFDPDETFNGQPAFYVETGNGDPRGGPPPLNAAGFPTDDDYYESLVKVEADPTTTATNQNANGWGMKIVDYFTPYNVNALDDADEDFGSGSPLVLPDSAGIPGHPHLIVAAGKEGTIYLLDRDNLGKFNVNDDAVLNSVYNASTGITTPPVLINGSLSTPAYYHGTLYWVAGYNSNAWSYVVAPNPAPDPPTVPVATLEPTSETANGNFGYVPGSVMITADGSEDPAGGIAWIMDTANGELHAYSTLSLSTELWNSGAGSIATVKFAVPTIANGQVFVGTQNSLQSFGLTVASTPAQPPNIPANLRAQALSGSAIQLNWTDSTVSPNFATNYAIQKSTNGVNFTTVANAGQEATSYTVTGLSQNTTYYFQIVGSNTAGSSGPSTSANARTTNQTGQTPTAPAGLGATPASGSEVYLTWTNTATNETGFTLTRATDPLFTKNVVTETLASAPYYYTDGYAGLSPGNAYYYKLQATNSSGLSNSSNAASVNIPNVPPAPTNPAAVLTSGQVVLSWTDHAGPFALGYEISRSVDGGPYASYAERPETSDSPPSTQTFTDTNVPLGHSYTYEVVAENVSGFSAPAYATVGVLGLATLSLDNGGDLVFAVSSNVPDRLSVQLAAGIYTLTDTAVTIGVTGAGAGFVTGAGTSTVTIPAADVLAMSLDTAGNTDNIRIISDAIPILITADSGGGDPTINLGDPAENELISGTITNAGNGTLSISGSGTTTINGNLLCQGSGGVTLAGTGTIIIAGNINLGPTGNLIDSGSDQATITGVISGTATSGLGVSQGLVGTYFNLTAAGDLIQPAAPSNSAWLGNQTPVVIAQLIGPIDFPNIAANGFADSMGDPAYYNLGNGNNDNVEARWYGGILIPGTGTTPVPINFATTSDDGSMLYIDGTAVVSNNNFQGATQATGLVDLTPGLHAIDVEYYQGGGGASMDAEWDPSGGTNFVDIPNLALVEPANSLFKTGAGTLTLSNIDPYAGPTIVTAGKLLVNGQVDSAVTVYAGGTMGGAGTVPTATIQSGAFLSPGDSPGTFTVGSLSLATGATFNEELGGATAGTQYDQTVIPAGGSVVLGTATLNVSFLGGFRPTVGQPFTLIHNQSGSAVNGTFSQGSAYSSNGYLFAINYAEGTGQDVVLTGIASVNPVAEAPYNGQPHGTIGQIFVNNMLQNAAVVYTDSANNVLTGPPVDAGTYTATVSFPGDSNYPPGSISTPIVIDPAGTTTPPTNTNAGFSVNSQSVTLTGSVSSGAGPVNTGTITFTVAGLGSVTSGTVSNGTASASLPLPAGTAPGTFATTTAYSGSTDFASSSNSSGQLDLQAAQTVTASTNATTTTTTSDQTVTLMGSVTSGGGPVYGGTFTFTVAGLGSVTSIPVSNGTALATLTIPGNTAAGPYSITTTYSGATDFASSSNNAGSLSITSLQGSTLPSQLNFTVPTERVARTAGSAFATVIRTGGLSSTVTVNYVTTDGTAHAGTDYTTTSGTLTLAPGVIAKTIALPILNDGQNLGNESFTLWLSNPTAAATLGTTSAATVIINDPLTVNAMPSNLAAVAVQLTTSAKSFQRFITNAYNLYLKRVPEAGGLAFWTTQMQNGTTDEQLEANFLGSTEYIQDHGGAGSGWVTGMYEDLLGRAPDASGLSYWTTALMNGANPEAVAYSFAASEERAALRIGADYEIFLGRPLDAAGQTFWVQQLLNGARNEDVVAAFVASKEYYENTTKGQSDLTAWVDSAFEDIFGRDPTAAELSQWLSQLH